MQAFCNPEVVFSPNGKNYSDFTIQMKNMKNSFVVAQIVLCVIGVIGNILNLRTLQSPALQTVPFMYIRALAVFDLISLSGILFHFCMEKTGKSYGIMFYMAYFEAPLINTFLVAGLYCAFMLTLERYLLISRPHSKSRWNPRRLARLKIALVLFFVALLHVPMMLQSKLKHTYSAQNGEIEMWTIANNVDVLCQEPHWTLYNYYKILRECLRFFLVVVMTILNIVIARKLQLAKMRRRRLVRRSSPSDLNTATRAARKSSTDENGMARREQSILVRSFTEKKLTGLMVAICVIFILGNIPQMIVMVLQNEAMENVYEFQVYRNVANLLEVTNHCLNFYVFCMASSDYMRSFLLNCVCLRNLLLKIPRIADFIAARRSSSMIMSNMSGLVIQNREDSDVYLPPSPENALMEEREDVEDGVLRPKGILVTGVRSSDRRKRSLTIANRLVVSEEIPL